ncbi:hypothetical protein HOE425_340081 [Hoeflea sp. EC-HK425]|nr:hypothetical protein HOE425_340081 [Hoeflea sp. EC-HK425]
MAGLADPPVGHPVGDPVQADPAASGTRRCTASSFVLPHVTAATRRPSSRLDRNVRDPSGDGSGISVTRDLEGVKEMGLRARRAPSPSGWGRMRISASWLQPSAGNSKRGARFRRRDHPLT